MELAQKQNAHDRYARAHFGLFPWIHSQNIKGEQGERTKARNQLSHLKQFTKSEGKTWDKYVTTTDTE